MQEIGKQTMLYDPMEYIFWAQNFIFNEMDKTDCRWSLFFPIGNMLLHHHHSFFVVPIFYDWSRKSSCPCHQVPSWETRTIHVNKTKAEIHDGIRTRTSYFVLYMWTFLFLYEAVWWAQDAQCHIYPCPQRTVTKWFFNGKAPGTLTTRPWRHLVLIACLEMRIRACWCTGLPRYSLKGNIYAKLCRLFLFGVKLPCQKIVRVLVHV